MTNTQIEGVLGLLLAVVSIAAIIWVAVKRGIRWDTRPDQFSTGYLWLIKIAIGYSFVQGIIDVINDSIFWAIVYFSIGVYGIYWLRKRPN
jgi:hypothetical protein